MYKKWLWRQSFIRGKGNTFTMGTAYLRGKKAGLHQSIHEANLAYPKANQKRNNLAVPGGRMGHANPEIVQRYLREIARRDKVKPRE